MDLSAQAMAERKEIHLPVEVALLRALKRRPWRLAMVEYARVPRRIKRSALFATALELGKRWCGSLPPDQQRIGVLLPNSSTSVMVNLGLRLAGRVPVNLAIDKRFSAQEMRATMEAHGIRTVISTTKLREDARGDPLLARGGPRYGTGAAVLDLRIVVEPNSCMGDTQVSRLETSGSEERRISVRCAGGWLDLR